jgi:hypothetical protein
MAHIPAPAEYGEKFGKLFDSMLQYEPEKRPTMGEVENTLKEILAECN